MYVHWKDRCNSFIYVISGVTSRNADDIAMYSASTVLELFMSEDN